MKNSVKVFQSNDSALFDKEKTQLIKTLNQIFLIFTLNFDIFGVVLNA